MRAEIISVGTELLLGETVDTNSTTLSKALTQIGVDVVFRSTVGDHEERIAQIVSDALDRVELVIVSGGLGPTSDDVTREGVAAATGRPLSFHQHLLDAIAKRFEQYGVPMTDNNRSQAYIPRGALPIINPVGTAPVFILSVKRGTVMVLPGVPREMEFLMEEHLIPWIRANLSADSTIVTHVLRTAGIGESALDDRIGDLMQLRNPSIGLSAKTGQTDIRITARAVTREAALDLIKPLEQDLRARIGDYIYGTGTETLEEVIFQLLGDDLSLGVIEAGTSGLLATRLDVTNELFVTVDDMQSVDIKTKGKLDAIAKRAATFMRKTNSVDFAVALLIEPQGSGYRIGYAVKGPRISNSRYFEWPLRQEDVAVWTSTWAMAMLRVALMSRRGQGT